MCEHGLVAKQNQRQQNRAAEARREERIRADPLYAARRRESKQAAEAKRRAKRRADPVARLAYNAKQRTARDPAKREAATRRASERRKERIRTDEGYRARRAAIARASDQRRLERRKADLAYGDAQRAYARAWYAANRDRVLAQRRAVAAKRGEEIRAYRRRVYAANPQKVLTRMRNWIALHPERAHAWRRANDHKRRVAGMHFTAAEWLALVERFAGACAYCGRPGNLEADHVIPISRGGTNDIQNILPACRACNRSKGPRTLEEFLARYVNHGLREAA
jgi:5-methylcytosine-specific restriction endonuclease McrA